MWLIKLCTLWIGGLNVDAKRKLINMRWVRHDFRGKCRANEALCQKLECLSKFFLQLIFLHSRFLTEEAPLFRVNGVAFLGWLGWLTFYRLGWISIWIFPHLLSFKSRREKVRENSNIPNLVGSITISTTFCEILFLLLEILTFRFLQKRTDFHVSYL